MRFQRDQQLAPLGDDLGAIQQHIETGALLCLTGADEPCPICGCRFGNHAVVAAGATEPRRPGHRRLGVRCGACDVHCGSWTQAVPRVD